MRRTYKFDDAPNIDLKDKRVIWWNENHICIDNKKLTKID